MAKKYENRPYRETYLEHQKYVLYRYAYQLTVHTQKEFT